jgi:Tfp pilus assembly protein PilW
MKLMQQRQAGASLMEVLVAMSISLVVTASMVALMANSLSSTARIIKMTKLADEMRVAMQMMTRDVRRSSFNGDSMLCYANEDCGTDGTPITLAGDISLTDTDSDGSNDCFTFQMDRNYDGDSTNDEVGGFRRVNESGIGAIEMYTGSAGVVANCASDNGWVRITDPEDMDIFAFVVDDDLSYTQAIQTDSAGNPLVSQKIRKIRMNLQGRLVVDPTIVRRMEDVISVRNDLLL